LPCIFVRLTGCNLRCVWCDTAYAFHGGTKYSLEEVLARISVLAGDGPGRVSLVEIKGGEPLLQPETPALAEELLAAGYTVMIETSGERFIGVLPREVIKIVDVKCPDSGEADTFRTENLNALTPRDEVKFVIASRRDYEFARDFIQEHSLSSRVAAVILSPAFRKDAAGARDVSHCLVDPQELAEWMLADGLQARLGLQVHKFIWEPSLKGV
jgi:7-carboxy-7-deazaguanine synthase